MEGAWKIMGVPTGQKTARVLSTSKEAGVPAHSPMAFGIPKPVIANDRAYWQVTFPADTPGATKVGSCRPRSRAGRAFGSNARTRTHRSTPGMVSRSSAPSPRATGSTTTKAFR